MTQFKLTETALFDSLTEYQPKNNRKNTFCEEEKVEDRTTLIYQLKIVKTLVSASFGYGHLCYYA